MEMRHAGFGGLGRFGNVVCLFGGRPALTYPAIAQVDAYWEGLRAGRLMPDRSEIDPRGMESALEYAFVLEQVAPGIGRVRISGMHLRDLLGMEVRGMPLTAFFVPDARDRIQKVLESVGAVPQVADIALSGETGIGRPSLTARLFLAPLANSASGGSPRILACLESHGQIGRAPRRFSVDQVQMRRIVETAGAPPMRPAPAPEPSARADADQARDKAGTRTRDISATGFAEGHDRFRAAPPPPRPSLRLVKDTT